MQSKVKPSDEGMNSGNSSLESKTKLEVYGSRLRELEKDSKILMAEYNKRQGTREANEKWSHRINSVVTILLSVIAIVISIIAVLKK
jgi:cytochrome c-type biogenesis protein CcmH/NrfG